MESVHGVDVSWMTHSGNSSQKDNHSKSHHSHDLQPPQPPQQPTTDNPPGPAQNGESHPPKEPAVTPQSKPIPGRPGLSRNALGASPSPPRRPSWLSSISSKFSSSSPGAHYSNTPPSTSPQIPTQEPAQDPPVPAGPHSPKNVILPHGAKGIGEGPYTPAPPRSTQSGFLQSALRRLSSSSATGGQSFGSGKAIHHGLCERMVLNVDHHRERCSISELNQSKLRRVAFCVDVEIASGPRYSDEASEVPESDMGMKDKRRLSEKGEAAALKNPEAFKDEKVDAGVTGYSEAELPTGRGKDTAQNAKESKDAPPTGEKDTTKKKEKKKRSEEERKARKEKKRKQAEENGAIPVELVREKAHISDSSPGSTPGTRTPKTQSSPTTDPIRIYRRCCQLRETPILKKITEQLGVSSSTADQPGVIDKLDLTGYWLHLPDLVTLGDYLAVVPVRELVLENCGLTDEGARVILAGLLAAKPVDSVRRLGRKPERDGEVVQGGFIERLVLKNNSKIGRDGWRYICLFINMCRSLKTLDVSKVPFPQVPEPPASHPNTTNGHLSRTTSASSANSELSHLLAKAIGDRLAGSGLELLNMAECGLTTDQLGDLVDGFIKSGLRRLGIAGNRISSEGMKHVARYLREGRCDGLDLGGNDLKDQLGTIAEALGDHCGLVALSLADCNLNPEPLWALFPALAKLENFRFIDLSQNHDLFDANPSALSILRRYLPKMPMLKRIHLTDVSMTPEQAIALAEILPDMPSLAQLNILDNPKLAALANAKDEANQEEACALYASLMAAVRVSKTIICIDIEVPSNDSSEVVKALAKQVVAYCLWNMERGPVAEISEAVSEPFGSEKEVAVPDVLLHLVGHVEGAHDIHDEDEAAPDEDYVIGGTGVVKALGICLLNRGNDAKRSSPGRASPDVSDHAGGSTTPDPVSGGKAKQMSKNLLGSARRIRARLQPALIKEARESASYNYQRLLALDQTLEGMIKRFEDEFPETRLQSVATLPPGPGSEPQISPANSVDLTNVAEGQNSDNEHALIDSNLSDDDYEIKPVLSRHNSDVSIASRALSQEEGRMHRFGQKFRRDLIKEDGPGHEPGSAENEEHIRFLKAMVDGLDGTELQKRFESEDRDAVLEDLTSDASVLRDKLIDSDPDYWNKLVESHKAAQKNLIVHGGTRNSNSAVE